MRGVKVMRRGVVALSCAMGAVLAMGQGPVRLQVNNLTRPLGLDDAAPSLSWQLDDTAHGARQTAYEVQVATSIEALKAGRADVWDSGRVASGQSIGVKYAGGALTPSTRYWWRVTVWDAAGKAYAASEPNWWETGLMSQDAWHAGWIGYETKEEAAVRHAAAAWIAGTEKGTLNAKKEQHTAFRATVTLAKAVKKATLYATAEDTVSAWVNGAPVLEAQPFPAWQQMPWKKFVRTDVTSKLQAGANLLALESVRYDTEGDALAPTGSKPPMITTLYVEYADGSTATFVSDATWKTAAQPAQGWQAKEFDDKDWAMARVRPESGNPLSAPPGRPWIPDSVKALRHEFAVKGVVESARLYATALGAYEFWLNGKPVSQDLLAPGWTDYRQRVFYQTYDVTALVTNGANALAALLAPGWYATPLEWFQQPNNYGDTPPALRAQMRIEYADGHVEWVKTSEDWKARESEIQSAEIYDGEMHDARVMEPGWEKAGFAAKGWAAAENVAPRPLSIFAQDFQPIRIEREVQAVKVTEVKPGVWVYDFGQNLAGIERLRVTGPRGTDVRVRFAELANDDGTIFTDNLRTAKATDHFVLAGSGEEVFEPRFTFHGFRYAEITGLKSSPGKDALTALVVHTDATFAAQLKTGSAMINKLWSNIVWGQRSNFVGVPTDCPQRDERLGWAADAQVFWRAAAYNMDLTAFSRKFAGDLRGTQAGSPYFGIYAPGTASEHSSGSGAGWSDAGVVIPWTSWLQTGDMRVIAENWAAMEKYLAAIEKKNPDGLWAKDSGIPFGDWLAPEGRTDQVLVATAYWAYDVTLMREMAHAVGRSIDEARYAALFEKIRAAFAKKFVRPDGTVLGTDKGPSLFGERTKSAEAGIEDTQTGYVLALHMNLVPNELRADAAQKLVDKIEKNHGLLATGFLGTPYLLEELTKAGHADEAYKLLLNTAYPSWGYLVEHGATTMWERWNADQMKDQPGMNSYNHYAYGAVADWIYRYAAGVDTTPLDAGFHTVVLHPVFNARLGSLEFSYPSTYGMIESRWAVKDGVTTWTVTLPANTTGWLPLDAATAARWTLGGGPLSESHRLKAVTREAAAGYEVESGTYTFTVKM